MSLTCSLTKMSSFHLFCAILFVPFLVTMYISFNAKVKSSVKFNRPEIEAAITRLDRKSIDGSDPTSFMVIWDHLGSG
jgi:hypothetical protein